VIHSVFLLIAGCIILETIEQILYRLGGRAHEQKHHYWTFVAPGVAVHLIRLALWYLLLSRVQLGLAIPLLGANYLVIALAGRYLFNERVDARRWLGTALVLAGFILVAMSMD
jgi:drug/metabolite transporter (DMT)-like permease